ncbi:hypothetical protein NQ318_006631 [Aromia moschata]|uniref:Malectin domain-containing protein n=1 Tax=Aromia moschata TaxID=1265417 RepID=A0AAV8XF78_9CUCU|nr:hypothetical protein NQ318_006631 [Aromia moschata]
MILRNPIEKSVIRLCCLLSLFFTLVTKVRCTGQLVYAVNCGGEAHTDSYGIRYERDPLHGRIGIASDYGTRLLIGRIPPNDFILYQTERYHTNSFGYDIPVSSDGDYVLVLKFCEVYFNAPNQKVFDVLLNGNTIIRNLDIFEKVGRGVAHDEYIPFRISKGRVFVKGEESELSGGRIRIDFIKGYKDNPKINAMYVMKGTLEDIPKLPPIPVDSSPIDSVTEEPEVPDKQRRPSGPQEPDPYTEESSLMLPIFIAIGAFIPLLFLFVQIVI